MENEYVTPTTQGSHFQAQIEQESLSQPLVNKWGDFEDGEAYSSDEDHHEAIHVEDENELNMNDDGVDIRDSAGDEEMDSKWGEEGDEILSNYESDDRDHALLLESEDEQNLL